MTGPAGTASTAFPEASREAGVRYAFANLAAATPGIMQAPAPRRRAPARAGLAGAAASVLFY